MKSRYTSLKVILTPFISVIMLFTLFLHSDTAHALPVTTAENHLSCAGSRITQNMNCNAGEFAAIVNLSHASDSPVSCTEGDYFILNAEVSMENSNADRYNIGFFIGETGNDPRASTGQCSVATFPTSPDPWFNGDANVCGDYKSRGISTPLVQNLRVLCTPDSIGQLQVPYVVSYQQSSSACTGPIDVKPGSPSKCNAGVASITNVIVLPQPLAYYRFDANGWSGSAGEVLDQSGNYPGTAYGGVNTANAAPAIPDNPGTCRYGDFDGNNDYIALPGFPNLTGSFTISAWIRPNPHNGSQSDWRIFADDQNNSDGYALSLHDGGAGRLRFFSRGVNPVILDTDPIVPANTWSFVTIVHDASSKKRQIYLNGTLEAEDTYTGNWGVDAGLASIGGEVSGTSESTPRWRFDGAIDEVSVYDGALLSTQINQLMRETRTCGEVSTDIDHFRFHHDAEGLTCSPETIRIQACLDSGCTTEATDPVSASLLPSGWAGGDNVVFNSNDELLLHYTTAGTATLGVSSSTPSALQPARCYIGGVLQPNCNITFHDSGFVFDVPDHTADSTETVTIRAVRKDDDTQQCIPGFQNETKSVGFWFDYLDPNAGTLAVNIDGTAISDTSPGTSFDLDFDNNGESQFDLRYPDVGLMRLNARHDGSGDSAGLVMTGLDQFITKPAYFTLDIPGNPGTAMDASGAVFLAAGVDFPITVSARNASGDITPNYGREATPESVLLTSLLVEPAGGNLPDIDGTFGTFGEDCDGNPAAAGTACGLFYWPEVGIIQLRPSVLDGNYLGAGDVIGTTSNNVGRFIPDRFSVSATNGTLDDFCGGFSYTGQPIAYQDTPNYLLTAQAATGATTLNYTGAFMKLTTAGLTIDPISSDASRLGSDGVTLTDLGRVAGTPSLTDNADGTVTYEFGNDTFTYTKNDNAKIGPYDSDIQLTLSAASDTDGVSANGLPVNATPDSVEIRFGRLSLNNTHGSELIALSSPMFTEHYNDSGFYQSNSLDSCTSTDIATHYSFTPSTGLSSTPGPALPVFVTGESALTFTAPGAGNTGFVDVITSISTDLPWLLDDRDSDGDYDDEAEARVTFGIYEGSPQQIYFGEVYD